MDPKEIESMRKLSLKEAPFEVTGLPWLYKYGKYDRFIPFIIPATQRGFKIFVDEAVKTGRQMVTN